MQFIFNALNDLDELPSEIIFIPVTEGEKVPDNRSVVQKTLARENFSGKEGEVCAVPFEDNTVVFIGCGNKEDDFAGQKAGSNIASYIKRVKKECVSVCLPTLSPNEVASVAYGIGLGLYSFDVYKTEKEDKNVLVHILSDNPTETEKAFTPFAALMDGIYEARDLVSEPANMMYPEEFVEVAKQLDGVTVSVMDEKEMEKRGMNLILGVAEGASHKPRLLTVSYMNGGKKRPTIALVGKGVCFDSGGISLKPSKGMEDMKYDMAGAAAVLGTMSALAKTGIKANVVGVMPLVENMPSATAQRPGDVIQSLSGKTVEVVNTDAEGRLILADAVTYAQEEFNPDILIDLATLTGAMKVALGTEMAGLFSNCDELAKQLEISSQKTLNDRLWRMPLHKGYDKMLDSDIADVSNMGSRPEAGSAVGAHFIGRFIENGVRWAHLDIAGMAWTTRDKTCIPKGATGFGVELLTTFIKENSK